jgi:hypothetical protein
VSGGDARDVEGAAPVGAQGTPRRRPGTRRLGCWLLLAALVLAAVGHWAYWYRPRPRPLAPADGELLAQGPAGAVRLWVPYPHQNLGALTGAVEQPDELLAALARLAALPAPRLPRFPLFGRPPAHELLLVASDDGASFAALVRLYPLPAALARLAGSLAGNPWLAGGEVTSGTRRGRVSWDGTTWRLESGDVRPRPASRRAASPLDDRLLGLIELETAAATPGRSASRSFPLPPGRYVLRREGDDLSLRLAGRPAAASHERDGAAREETVAPVAMPADQGVVLFLARRRDQRREALLLLDREGGLLGGLPAAAAWAAPQGAEGLLPAGELLATLTGARVEPLAGGELAGTDRDASRQARELAASWLPLVAGDGAPAFALWLEPTAAARRAEQVADALEKIPLLGAAEGQRWRDAATVLAAVRGYRAVTGRVRADRRAGELRLVR